MERSAAQIAKQARQWVKDNQGAWEIMLAQVSIDVTMCPFRELRIVKYTEMVRDYGYHVPNSINAYLARMLEIEVDGARFKKASSKLDLFFR